MLYGFESTIEIIDSYRKRHEIASQSGAKLYHFSGFIKNDPVCSLSLSLCGHNVRIDDLATTPAYQRKGYATQLVHAAIDFAKTLNASKCFLEASADGLSLYQKIGFKELFINRHYQQMIERNKTQVYQAYEKIVDWYDEARTKSLMES